MQELIAPEPTLLLERAHGTLRDFLKEYSRTLLPQNENEIVLNVELGTQTCPSKQRLRSVLTLQTV